MFAAAIDLIYDGLFWLCGMALILLYSYRVENRRRVPRTGPVLLIANHQSYLDPIALGLAAPRRVYFLAKQPLFTGRILGAIMRAFDTISVDSAGFSRSGLEGILEHINRGLTVLVFPEGERCWDGKVNELKPGVTLLIRKSNATVVPLGLAGAFESWPRFRRLPRFAPPFLSWNRGRIAVSVGEPLNGALLAKLPRDEAMAIMQLELQKAVQCAEKLRGKRSE